MSTREKRDVLLHFDEERGEIIFYTVDSKRIEGIRNQEFDGARSDIEWFQSKDPGEAEKALGSMVFSLIDTFSKKIIGIRDYKTINEAAHQEYVADLEIQSKEKDPEAKYLLFIEYHSRALREKNLAYLEKSEELLNTAAELGSQDAKERLSKDWGLMKTTALKRIQRG